MRRSSFSSLICFSVAVLLFAMQACNVFSDERENQTTTFEQNYIIAPLSLLDALDSGEGAFMPVDAEPEFLEPSQQIMVNWTQLEYLRIVSSFNQMNFEKNCFRMEGGFQKGSFWLFKNIKIRERESRMYRYIDIDTRNNSIYVREAEFYPRLAHWSSIELMDIKISADLALRIAEESGGRDKRLSFDNVCGVFVRLSPDSPRYRGWNVQYIYNNKNLFQIQINPSTGKKRFP
jgi:hypothetical protein